MQFCASSRNCSKCDVSYAGDGGGDISFMMNAGWISHSLRGSPIVHAAKCDKSMTGYSPRGGLIPEQVQWKVTRQDKVTDEVVISTVS